MALKPRNIPDEILFAIVAANNQRMVDGISTSFHADRTAAAPTFATAGDYKNPVVARLAVTLAAATDSLTQIALTNELKRVYNIHAADLSAHDTVAGTAVTVAAATDQTSAWALANDIKSKYGTHLSASNVHFNNDATNTISAANATDSATLQTLVNEIRTDIAAHMASAPAGVYIEIQKA